jgi:hypothetical protein
LGFAFVGFGIWEGLSEEGLEVRRVGFGWFGSNWALTLWVLAFSEFLTEEIVGLEFLERWVLWEFVGQGVVGVDVVGFGIGKFWSKGLEVSERWVLVVWEIVDHGVVGSGIWEVLRQGIGVLWEVGSGFWKLLEDFGYGEDGVECDGDGGGGFEETKQIEEE